MAKLHFNDLIRNKHKTIISINKQNSDGLLEILKQVLVPDNPNCVQTSIFHICTILSKYKQLICTLANVIAIFLPPLETYFLRVNKCHKLYKIVALFHLGGSSFLQQALQ